MSVWNTLVRARMPEILIEINNTEDSISIDIAKKLDMTYSHLSGVLKILIDGKLINSEKKGRINILTLTKKGRDIAEHFEIIKKEIGNG